MHDTSSAQNKTCVSFCAACCVRKLLTRLPAGEGAFHVFRLLPSSGGSASAPLLQTAHRVELLRDNGRLLRRFGFEECDAGSKNEFRGVRRGHLLRVLADSLPPGTISFGERVSRLVQQGGSAGSPWPIAQLEKGSTIEAGVLVAADGARSTLAREGLGLPPPGYAGYTAYRGVACPEGGTASLGIPLDTIRVVWGTGVRAGQYALNDKEVYWFTVFNAPADEAVPPSAEARMADALKYVKGWAWGLEETIRSTPATSLSRSRITDRWTLGAFGKGLVTLAG
ncbi:hypothetical protein DUNSADRAFT_10858 [Dunaliella salina]|uniref:FAD-binding domain-containing protein n=1 Tax=Dunaliella salina TaxID=3046 RepID=A0ABQ7HA05_DUNSA|nr:hypothetical protein DUNSADRAFT_10858 [Dunaliella salina]|eukprot:KAF5843684.1 hypothetical protein DUNSADRAFT_10858 [Dunaliella salina]